MGRGSQGGGGDDPFTRVFGTRRGDTRPPTPLARRWHLLRDNRDRLDALRELLADSTALVWAGDDLGDSERMAGPGCPNRLTASLNDRDDFVFTFEGETAEAPKHIFDNGQCGITVETDALRIEGAVVACAASAQSTSRFHYTVEELELSEVGRGHRR